MKQKSRNLWWLFAAVIGLSVLGWFINMYTPSPWYRIGIFFLIIAFTSYSIFLFLFNNVRRAWLASTGVSIYFILRLLNLREPFYVVLLFITLFSLVFMRKKNK